MTYAFVILSGLLLGIYFEKWLRRQRRAALRRWWWIRGAIVGIGIGIIIAESWS